ncbi:MAG: diguanylate cyclase/phosphodiesterase (GGDEF & EAL domains) with PAS/PAC sensor(s) [uncultured Acidimicrobiales bacterium]|uniref:Diguanylate cyclase/phosphodiesterase (GGDEF & EAL domains) with PAS/PAC sensor(S) n=1 Tax=uncultured Acidimicrobiales bacterium TaxID=310071 RepID=A0A6J4IE37_9ACTN|nr:MAG: diguanylate cyclase/phosphodiesterase (GGDEF & EAL domains) with PAS/PAC sensor(s) [uncultured Acidimicrobiales bacterium]
MAPSWSVWLLPGLAVLAVAAVGLMVAFTRRLSSIDRHGWRLLSAAPLLAVLPSTRPLSAVVLVASVSMIGFMVMPRRRRLRGVLDVALVASCVVFSLWPLVGPRVAGEIQAGGVWERFTAVLALLAVSASAVVVANQTTALRRGLAVQLVGVAGISVVLVNRLPAVANAVAVVSGAAAILLAGHIVARVEQDGRLVDVRRRPASMLVSGVAIALAVAAGGRSLIGGDYLEPFIGVTGIAVVLLVLGRQLVTIVESAWTARDLEDEIAARTAELQTSEVRFRSLVQTSSDVVTILDEEGVVLFLTPSVERVFGYRPSDCEGRSLWGMLHPDDVPLARKMLAEAVAHPDECLTVEWRLSHQGGGWSHCESTVRSLLHEPSVCGIVLNTRDVTERKGLEEQLIREALHDSLTGLANRGLLRDRANRALDRRERMGHQIAVLLIDLDDFKAINDGLGHAAGDEALGIVARRLLGCVEPGDTVARLGGDEFAILLEAIEPGHPAVVAEKIQEMLRLPMFVLGHEVFTPASVGVATTSHSKTADELLENADMAMYLAKGRGKGQVAMFVPEMHVELRNRLTVVTELRHAVARQEFSLRFQPLVDLKTRRLMGVEALLRWRHPRRGLLTPDAFIALAETSGIIVPLGRWIMAEAMRELAQWHAAHPRPDRALSITINLSARQFLDPGLLGDVAAALENTGVAPGSVVLELTETMLMHDIEETIDTLRALKRLGVRLALDDFGTGYSSLSYLRRFPIDILKIDRSFVTSLTTEEGPDVVRSILNLADTFKLTTVAEGIENSSQLAMLRALGCTYGQGYLFAKPLRSTQVEQLLADEMRRHERAASPALATADDHVSSV